MADRVALLRDLANLGMSIYVREYPRGFVLYFVKVLDVKDFDRVVALAREHGFEVREYTIDRYHGGWLVMLKLKEVDSRGGSED